MGQKSRPSLAESSTSAVSQDYNLHISQGWGLIWKLIWEGFTSKLTPLLGAGFNSPVSCWLLPRGWPQFLPQGPLHPDFWLYQEHASWESNREGLLVRCTVIISSLITEVAFPWYWSILLVKSRQVYTGCEYQEAKIPEAIVWATYNISFKAEFIYLLFSSLQKNS